MKKLLIAFVALAGLLMSGPRSEGRFQFRDATPDSLELLENGQPVFVYNHGMILKDGIEEKFRRSSYLHPVYAPNGVILTDDFPKDHHHHRGICWSWPDVEFLGKTYDVWAVEGMHQRFVKWIERKATEDGAVLSVENGWFVGEQKAVREIVEIRVQPVKAGRRVMDFDLSFEAVREPVRITGREIKGYGGFGVRFAPRTDTVIRTDTGIEPKDTDMVPHRWAELEATFGGKRAGMRIDDSPANPGENPVGWCLRHYGYVAANYPGLKPVMLTPGHPLRLHYRVTVFSAT